jgi:hypothetical protein
MNSKAEATREQVGDGVDPQSGGVRTSETGMSDIPATSTNDAKAADGAELSACDSACAHRGETCLNPHLRARPVRAS